SSKKAKIVESKNANHSEPNHTWGSNATDIPSSSSLIMTGCLNYSLVSGLQMFETYDREPLSAHELSRNVTISRVHYVEGHGHNLFSVGQFYDADLKVAFWKNTCFICNLEGVDLLSGSRDINLYTISLDDMLKTSPICLLSKASKTKSWLWHHQLSHLNFGTLNKLAKDGLARGILRLKFQKDHLCSTCTLGKSKKSSHQPKAKDTNQEKLYLLHMDLCVTSINGKRDTSGSPFSTWIVDAQGHVKKGKQHRAAFKTKQNFSIRKCLHLLHMDLFGPVSTMSINHEKYTLVIIDEYSRYTWVHFLRKKSQAAEMIISFIRMVENQNDVKVKQIKTDNGGEFRNHELESFCNEKGISHSFSSPYTPEQNGVAKRKNRTLIEAARTMLNGSVLSKHFWTEAVRIACYTQNRSIIDHLGKFDAKADDGYFLGYSFVSKAFRVFNTRRQQVEETYHVTFDESIEAIKFTNTLVDEIGIDDSSKYPSGGFIHEDSPSRQYQENFDISYYVIPYGRSLVELTQEKHVLEVIAPNEPDIPHTEDAEGPPDLINTEGTHEQNVQDEKIITQSIEGPSGNNTEVLVWSKYQHIKLVNIIGDPGKVMLTRSMAAKLTAASASECLFTNFLFEIEPKKVCEALKHPGWVDAMQKELNQFYRNKDEKGISICQEQYTRNLLKKYEISDSSSVKTPMVPPNNLGPDLASKPSATIQQSLVMSLVEAEYVVAVGCCASILWMKSQLSDYDIHYKMVPIFCDNTNAISIYNNPVLHSRTKHIDIRYHFIRDHILKGDTELHFIPIEYQLADIFTKPLDKPTFTRLKAELGMLNID
ncbi:retrovirus-related pol polyprotein from transposon TNT 1-94, partial [Tanacetum coccineum]